MKKAVRLDAEAEEEIAHAVEHYARERDELGLEFFIEVSEAIDALAEPGPECGPVIGLPPELGVRRKLLSRFPYAVVFVEGVSVVRVLSVMHGHRRPAYWRKRI